MGSWRALQDETRSFRSETALPSSEVGCAAHSRVASANTRITGAAVVLARGFVHHDVDVQLAVEPNRAIADAELVLGPARRLRRNPNPLRGAGEQGCRHHFGTVWAILFEGPSGLELHVVGALLQGHRE